MIYSVGSSVSASKPDFSVLAYDFGLGSREYIACETCKTDMVKTMHLNIVSILGD